MPNFNEWWWYSSRLEQHLNLRRWGHWGQPVLLFPTAGGDAGEVERRGLIAALQPMIDAGRIKVYSVDSVAGAALAAGESSVEHRCWLFKQFGEYVAHEVVPAIWSDSAHQGPEPIVTGASIGAFNAVSVLCRYPHLFRMAIGMSGSYDLEPLLGAPGTEDYYLSAPLSFLPNLGDEAMLEQLRRRYILLACGQGRWENVDQSWRMAGVLGDRGIPNRVDIWGHEYDHDWYTWLQMLPTYLNEFTD